MITHTVITSVTGKHFIFGGMKTHCFAPQVAYDGRARCDDGRDNREIHADRQPPVGVLGVAFAILAA